MSNRIHILNTKIDNLSRVETVQKVEEAIKHKKQLHHVVVNALKVVVMWKCKQMPKSVNACDITNVDGQAIV